MNVEQKIHPLRVDIVSDVSCPWCVLGYLQLQKALDQCEVEFAPTLYWHPYELNPRMPTEGQDRREHMTQKFGARDAGQPATRTRFSEAGEALGFEFRSVPGSRIYNTFLAHQLLHWAGLEGRQSELSSALFDAHFSRCENVGDIATLAEIAGRAGLPEQEAARILTDGRYAVAVREAEALWHDREVYAVPHFVFDEKYIVPGAQEADTFERVILKILDKRQKVAT